MNSRLSGAIAASVAVPVSRRMKAMTKMTAAMTASIGRLLPWGGRGKLTGSAAGGDT